MESREKSIWLQLLFLLLFCCSVFALLKLSAKDPAELVVTEEILNTLPKEEGYSFIQLSGEEMPVYREIHWALLRRAKDLRLSTNDPGLLDKAFNALTNDHPELFYINGYSYFTFKRNIADTSLFFNADYNRSFRETVEDKKKIDVFIDIFLKGMRDGLSDYEKIKYAYEYLITHVDYDKNAEDSQNICSVFLRGKSVCSGYAKSLQYMLSKIGIHSCFVTGRVKGGEDHAWLVVRSDGDYYHVDPTWGDPSYQMSEKALLQVTVLPEINYDYFMVTDMDIQRTHEIKNAVKIPECVSIKDNYFVRENAYFTSFDTEQLKRLFDLAYEEERQILSIKCADKKVYSEMRDYLLTQQKVFDHLQSESGVVTYADKQEILNMSFWL